MNRRNRRNRDEQPAQQPAAAPAPESAGEELRALRERLAAIEQRTAPEPTWHPLDRHRAERERWIAANTRMDHADPCAACGAVGGEQRRTGGSQLLASAWLCEPCTEAVEIGWGTNRVLTPPRNECLDRLASLAAGQAEPTPGFRTLAKRYGLTFALARDAKGGDGTAWSHLGDAAEWRSVGAKAVRRHAAGFGVFPAADTTALRPEMVPVPGPMRLLNPNAPAYVEAEREAPTQEEQAAQLQTEEKAVEAALLAAAAMGKERAAQAAKAAERARIDREYRAACAAQEALFKEERRKLREARSQVHQAADTAADFQEIVKGF